MAIVSDCPKSATCLWLLCSNPHALMSCLLFSAFSSVQFSSVAQSCPTLWPHESQHAMPPCPSQTPGVYSNSCPSSRWCHPAISSSVVPFSSCPQSLPASGSFPMSQLFAWGGQSIRVSASASVLPVNTQDWSPLGWTGWISLQSKGFLRVFSNTTLGAFKFHNPFWLLFYFISCPAWVLAVCGPLVLTLPVSFPPLSLFLELWFWGFNVSELPMEASVEELDTYLKCWFLGEWTHIYIQLSHSLVHPELSQHCLSAGYTPI